MFSRISCSPTRRPGDDRLRPVQALVLARSAGRERGAEELWDGRSGLPSAGHGFTGGY